MKKLIIAILCVATNQSLASLDCTGKVERILDWPERCDGNMAFILKGDKSNGKYICTLSSKSESMVLSALMADKNIQVRLNRPDETCEQLSVHYLAPTYMHVFSD